MIKSLAKVCRNIPENSFGLWGWNLQNSNQTSGKTELLLLAILAIVRFSYRIVNTEGKTCALNCGVRVNSEVLILNIGAG